MTTKLPEISLRLLEIILNSFFTSNKQTCNFVDFKDTFQLKNEYGSDAFYIW